MLEPLIGIIILNWNGTADTLECLRSTTKLIDVNYRIYVIDNGSTTSCKEEVQSAFPFVNFVELPENRGFAGGVNVGIKVALADGADYVWLLNNDTVVEKATLRNLLKIAEMHPCFGIIGSKVLRYDNRAIIDHAGGKLYPWIGKTKHIGSGETDLGQYNSIRAVDYVTGCSLLAKRSVIEEVGLLPEIYFLYFEETEWCVRASRNGWKIIYATESRVYHKVGNSIGKESPRIAYYFARNSLLFIRRNFPLLLPLSILWWPLYFAINHIIKQRFCHLKCALSGLCDYLKGIVGKFKI